MVEFSIIFLYCDLIGYQSIGNQRAPLLRIIPAVENITSNVKSIQFEHLYYYRVSKDIITHLVPKIRLGFGELVQFKYANPLYVVSFSSKGVRNSINSILGNISVILILQCSYSHLIMFDPMIDRCSSNFQFWTVLQSSIGE